VGDDNAAGGIFHALQIAELLLRFCQK